VRTNWADKVKETPIDCIYKELFKKASGWVKGICCGREEGEIAQREEEHER
jgi:hypothetical protein